MMAGEDEGQSIGGEESGGMPVEEGAPIWMTTFGDLMSLLLTFFVLLFSMSEIRSEKFLVAAGSMREAMGGTAEIPILDPNGLSVLEEDPDKSPTDGERIDGSLSVAELLAERYLDDIAERVQAFIDANGLSETLLVTQGPDGVRVRINAGALFRPGSGTIEPEGEWIIDFLSALSEEIDVPVIISGHADNQPISTARFASNWELSAYRAAGLARRLEDNGYNPERIRVESHGSSEPVATNDTPEGRALNRRVEFFYDRKDVVSAIESWREELVAAEIPEADPTSPAGEAVEGNPGGA